jgi:hypothetical protein
MVAIVSSVSVLHTTVRHLISPNASAVDPTINNRNTSWSNEQSSLSRLLPFFTALSGYTCAVLLHSVGSTLSRLRGGKNIRNNVQAMDRLLAYLYWVPITIWEKLHMDQFKESRAYKMIKAAYDARTAYITTSITNPA